jgi:hypothetical protein
MPPKKAGYNMTEQAPQLTEVQFVRLSPEEAEVLAQAPEAIADLGHMALEGVEIVGVVDRAGDTPAQLVNMSSDPGTRINVSGETARARDNLERYGTPEAAVAQLDSLEQKENAEAITLAELAEQTGLSSVLKRYDTLSEMLQGGNSVIRRDIDGAIDDLRRLQSALGRAADEGPWSGNYMRNHPQLARQLHTMGEGLAAQANRHASRAGEQDQEVFAYQGKLMGTAEEVTRQIDRQSREARAFSASLDDVQLSLKRMSADSPAHSAVTETRQLANMLSSLGYDPQATPDEAKMLVARVTNKLEEIQHTLALGRGNRIAAENISEMIRLIQKTTSQPKG